MVNNRKQILIILIFAILATALSLTCQDRISSGGFFSLYQGSTYIGKGWPWMYFEIYESGKTNLNYSSLALTFVFWIIIGITFSLVIRGLIYLVTKVKNRKIT